MVFEAIAKEVRLYRKAGKESRDEKEMAGKARTID